MRRRTRRSSTRGRPRASSSLNPTACGTCCGATSRATVEDLTALNALYRPGPIQGGMIDDFIERKWGRKKVDYMLPELERLLKETLGVIVYQEQVMQIANVIAGYSLGEADLLRRAMGKKDAAEMAKQRERFMQGAARAQVFHGEGRAHFRPDGAVCGLRLQQVALGGLRPGGLSHGVSEDALSGGVHGGAADLGDRQDRGRGEVHWGVRARWGSRCWLRTCTSRHRTLPHHRGGGFGAGYGPEMGRRAQTPTGYKIRFGLSAVKNVGGNAIAVDCRGAQGRALQGNLSSSARRWTCGC